MPTLLTYTVLWTYLTTIGGQATVPVTVTRDGPDSPCWSSSVFAVDDFAAVPGARPGRTCHRIKFGSWNPAAFGAPELAGNVGPASQPCVFHRWGGVPALTATNSSWAFSGPALPPDRANQAFGFAGSGWSKIAGFQADVSFMVRP